MKLAILTLLLLVTNLGAEAQPRLTFALSPDFMALHDSRFPHRQDHLSALLKGTNAASFKVLCLGEKAITAYEDTRLHQDHFIAWLKHDCDPLVGNAVRAKASAATESCVATERRLFEAGEAAKDILVIFDWPCHHEGEVPGPEAFGDPGFALAIPEGSKPVASRGEVYWYFSQMSLESSLSKRLEGKDPAERVREVEKCRLALARMWATYLGSKGFRLMAFDAAIPENGQKARALVGTIQTDGSGPAIPPYDLASTVPVRPPPEAKKLSPESVRVLVEWTGSNVILPVYRAKDGNMIVPAAASEVPDEAQRRIFKSYKTFVSKQGKNIELHSRLERYLWETENLVTHSRELTIPVGEDGRAKGKLELYFYYGSIKTPNGFPVFVRVGDQGTAQKLVFSGVEGQGEDGRIAELDEFPGNWRRIDLP